MASSALKVGLGSIIAILVGIGTPSAAQSRTEFSERGDSFAKSCGDATAAQTRDVEQAIYCILYSKGVFDGALGGPIEACEPQGFRLGQKIDIGVQYIRSNPDKAHWPPSLLLLMGLREAYPCPKTAK
jgi:hypothetical protein